VADDVQEIRTDRLLLRRWAPADFVALSVIFAKPEVWWFPFKRGGTEAETCGFIERRIADWAPSGWSLWTAEHRSDERLIGYGGLSTPSFLPEVMPSVEIGRCLDPDYWGQGLATEGGRAALEFGFQVLGLDEIISIYEPENSASGRVMQRLGMSYDHDTTHPELGVPVRVYKLVRNNWQAAI
jgi:RimJ/RimL family protein N-acetyltransferase